jgi:hypothetical protein
MPTKYRMEIWVRKMFMPSRNPSKFTDLGYKKDQGDKNLLWKTNFQEVVTKKTVSVFFLKKQFSRSARTCYYSGSFRISHWLESLLFQIDVTKFYFLVPNLPQGRRIPYLCIDSHKQDFDAVTGIYASFLPLLDGRFNWACLLTIAESYQGYG